MKKLVFLLMILMVVLTACESKVTPTDVPVPPTEEPTDVPPPPTDVPIIPTEVPPTIVPPTAVPEPTLVPTDVPEPTATPLPDSYNCVAIKLSTAVFQKSYTKTGKLKVNAQGNWILKPLPKSDIRALANVDRWDTPNYENLRDIGRYQIGDIVCVNNNAFQVDNMRVYLIWDGPVAGYYIPILAITGE